MTTASVLSDLELDIADSSHTTTEGHVPGDASMWLFVIGDLVIFTAYFACYMFDRSQNPAVFLGAQQQLSQGIGVINTIVLLASSLFIALSAQAARAGDRVTALRMITLGGLCGVGFIVIKSFEWYLKISAGLSISTNEFFMYYYMLTSIHFFHVLLGLLILTLVWRSLRSARLPDANFVETGASYWHMVDLLWIIIYALLYLMR